LVNDEFKITKKLSFENKGKFYFLKKIGKKK
jgi:hypothetical protein